MSREYFAKVKFIEYQRFIYAPFSYDIQGYVLTKKLRYKCDIKMACWLAFFFFVGGETTLYKIKIVSPKIHAFLGFTY